MHLSGGSGLKWTFEMTVFRGPCQLGQAELISPINLAVHTRRPRGWTLGSARARVSQTWRGWSPRSGVAACVTLATSLHRAESVSWSAKGGPQGFSGGCHDD